MYSIDMLRDIAQLFSRGEALKWINSDFTSVYTKLKRHNLANQFKGKTYSTTLLELYQTLVKNYPNEYVVKNEYLNNTLIKEARTTRAVVYNEFRLGKAIADLSIFNGASHAYEIKTELDNKSRLDQQINEYKKIFNKVTLIVPEEQLHNYESHDDDTGIITYDSLNNKFHTVREAQYNINIEVDVLMEILHSKEYLDIINDNFGVIDGMNAFNQFNKSKELLRTLSQEKLNDIFIQTLKLRTINNSFLRINSRLRMLNQLSLALNLKKEETEEIVNNITLKTI